MLLGFTPPELLDVLGFVVGIEDFTAQLVMNQWQQRDGWDVLIAVQYVAEVSISE